MRAALIREVGASCPSRARRTRRGGDDVVEVLAAPINPIDLAVSRGVLATGHPELPYVPGCEVGGSERPTAALVWIFGGGARPHRERRRSPSGRRSATRIAIDDPGGRRSGARGRRSESPGSRAGCRSPGAPRSRGGEIGARARRDAARSGWSPCRRRSSSARPRVVAAGRSPAGLERAAGARGRRDAAARRARTTSSPRSRTRSAARARATSSTRSGERPRRPPSRPQLPWRDDRQPRPVGGRHVGPRLGRGSLQEPLDPRAHELRPLPRTSSPSTTRRLVGHVTGR